MHHHVAAAVEGLNRADRGEELSHLPLRGIGLLKDVVGRVPQRSAHHPISFAEKLERLIHRRIEVAVGVIAAGGILGKCYLELESKNSKYSVEVNKIFHIKCN